MSIKNSFFCILLILIFIDSFFFVLAANGCFVYKESAMYCQDTDSEQALQECDNYGGCNLQTDFFKGKGCWSVEECKKILCKSSCQEEFRGKCKAGEIPEGKEQEWCKEGCCKFYSERSFCEVKYNKWLCEVEARNKEAKKFAFDTQMKGEECNNYCNVELSAGSDVTQGVDLEDVPVLKNESERKVLERSDNLGIGVWIVIILAISGGVIYYVYNYEYTQNYQAGKEEEVENVFAGEEYFSEELREKELELARIKTRIEDIKEKHESKTKGKEREEFFAEFGLIPTKTEKGHLDRLKELGRIYELKKRRFSKIGSGEEKKALDKLANLVNKQKKLEEKVEAGVKKVEQKVEQVSKKEVEEALAALKRISQKK